MNNRDFLTTFLHNIEPGHHILDLGAGRGDFSLMFVERGATVTAVDSKAARSDSPSIRFVHMSVENFIALDDARVYDLVFMRNVAQFLEKHWVFETLFPWLDEHVTRHGLIGIETMYRDPNPPFDLPLRSLYTTQELSQHVSHWQELLVQDYDQSGPDMRGTIRHFFITDFIVRKQQ